MKQFIECISFAISNFFFGTALFWTTRVQYGTP
ncbi:hypothetical protein AP058_00195 [Flavobacterium sp. TAB 87]|nr:hypothetical protein AP058_00195 [Flavobacterium sp. TAB 87]